MNKTADCLTVNKIYHAAIYVRLSKEDGYVASAAKAESNSISNQKNLIKDFLKDKDDIIVVSERVDDGYSGSDFERPGFQMMMDDIRRGTVDCVIVKALSRLPVCGSLQLMTILTARRKAAGMILSFHSKT